MVDFRANRSDMAILGRTPEHKAPVVGGSLRNNFAQPNSECRHLLPKIEHLAVIDQAPTNFGGERYIKNKAPQCWILGHPPPLASETL